MRKEALRRHRRPRDRRPHCRVRTHLGQVRLGRENNSRLPPRVRRVVHFAIYRENISLQGMILFFFLEQARVLLLCNAWSWAQTTRSLVYKGWPIRDGFRGLVKFLQILRDKD